MEKGIAFIRGVVTKLYSVKNVNGHFIIFTMLLMLYPFLSFIQAAQAFYVEKSFPSWLKLINDRDASPVNCWYLQLDFADRKSEDRS